MIVMIPPEDEAVFRRFRLSSGNWIRPNFADGGRVRVTEEDAAELEAEGWSRDRRQSERRK